MNNALRHSLFAFRQRRLVQGDLIRDGKLGSSQTATSAAKSEERKANSEQRLTNKKGGRLAAFPNPEAPDLQNLYVLRLPALGPFDYVERDSLAFLQAAEAIGLDRRIVNKHVFPILT